MSKTKTDIAEISKEEMLADLAEMRELKELYGSDPNLGKLYDMCIELMVEELTTVRLRLIH
jgi:hypothetical protein